MLYFFIPSAPIREVTVVSLLQMDPLSFSEHDENAVESSPSPILVQAVPRADAPSSTGFYEPEYIRANSIIPSLPEARTGSAPSSTGYYTENSLIYSLRMPNALTGRVG
ncbi:hypothetical protein ACJMK2_032607 [Sinanodonta woodiana]|uniref:Uncharacterized protein n=1 Tax=Sinanodonta woodiana TaxID=1069815 RepID=A0ABD3X6B6_SINWO